MQQGASTQICWMPRQICPQNHPMEIAPQGRLCRTPPSASRLIFGVRLHSISHTRRLKAAWQQGGVPTVVCGPLTCRHGQWGRIPPRLRVLPKSSEQRASSVLLPLQGYLTAHHAFQAVTLWGRTAPMRRPGSTLPRVFLLEVCSLFMAMSLALAGCISGIMFHS